ncbi:MAG: molybdate ABC transporter permease subunit [Bacteroidetes bacterium]|nr:molybdate ABC transporter permease subunit [Bacteroidota bacterium]
MEWKPLILTLELAFATTLILLIVAIPVSYLMMHMRSRLKPFLETLISMPLVLPPTVLGFFFLIAFSPNNEFGMWIDKLIGIKLVFSFTGLVLASVIYSLPFMVNPILSGLNSLPDSISEASYLLGKSKRETLFKIQLPNIRSSILTGMVLSFAHTVGEFGVVLMIGGNIPGKTRVASIAIFDQVEAMNYHDAKMYSFILFSFTFAILLTVYLVNGNYLKKFWK